MQVRALVDFHATPYGRIRRGQIFSCEPTYAADQIRMKHIEIIDEDTKAPAAAPGKPLGKARKPEASLAIVQETAPDQPLHVTEPTTIDGQGRPLSASRRGRRSAKKT